MCDHDITDCVDEVAELAAKEPGLTHIKGVEVAVTFEKREYHILAYHIDTGDEELQELLRFNRKVRDDYDLAVLEYLKGKVSGISMKEYMKFDYNPYEGGWRMYGYLKESGLIACLDDYFALVNGITYEKVFKKPEDIIPMLKSKGIMTILAHPPAYVNGDFYDRSKLNHWVSLGIEGIECYTQYLEDIDNSRYYVNYCNEMGLKITGGSDCHGGFAGRKIGYPEVFESMIRL